MTELELYKYINENDIEWHRYKDNKIEEIWILPKFYQLPEFHKLCSPCLFDDGGIECRMKDGYLGIDIIPVCEHYGIEYNNIFKGDDYDN